jgi:uncharacterized protein YukE
MIDASGLVSSLLSPYQSAIGTVLQQVSGDPAMVRQAETNYRAGAASATQAATDLTGVSSRLSGSWTGQASTAYSGASRNLTGQLDQVQLTLNRQADGMARVAQAQDQARAGVERTLGGFTVASTSLLQMSRQVPPTMVGPLVAQARRTGAAYYGAAAAQRDPWRPYSARWRPSSKWPRRRRCSGRTGSCRGQCRQPTRCTTGYSAASATRSCRPGASAGSPKPRWLPGCRRAWPRPTRRPSRTP